MHRGDFLNTVGAGATVLAMPQSLFAKHSSAHRPNFIGSSG